jgi:hypothetical protein
MGKQQVCGKINEYEIQIDNLKRKRKCGRRKIDERGLPHITKWPHDLTLLVLSLLLSVSLLFAVLFIDTFNVV